jgi:hypothetical protein
VSLKQLLKGVSDQFVLFLDRGDDTPHQAKGLTPFSERNVPEIFSFVLAIRKSRYKGHLSS